MNTIKKLLSEGKSNFIFVGEAGCGKSEISLNFARHLAETENRPVHFFDMDMTKPLFRSRDVTGEAELGNVHFHFEEQFYDAPTMVGGVRECMQDENCIVVMDVGGDDIGARAVGGLMMGALREHTTTFYVLNSYRPFCMDIEHVDQILGEILAVSHIRLDEIHLIDNPNLGPNTHFEDVLSGSVRMQEIISKYKDIELTCVLENMKEEAEEKIPTDIFPIRLYLTYPWVREAVG